MSPALAGGFFTTESPGKPKYKIIIKYLEELIDWIQSRSSQFSLHGEFSVHTVLECTFYDSF